MAQFRVATASEQVAHHLAEQIRMRVWVDTLPGEIALSRRLGVGRETVRAAVQQLEKEGLISMGEHGKRRHILQPIQGVSSRALRIRVLLYERRDSGDIDISTLMSHLKEAGFDAEHAPKSLQELGADPRRVAQMVNQNPADAWITISSSREINEWFSRQRFPTLAMSGLANDLPMAAAYPIMIPSLLTGVRRLIELGHQRIVMFTRRERRKPQLARPEQAFMDELNAAGILNGDYHMPEWEESRNGLEQKLDTLFRLSPPTALIFQEAPIFIAARQYLSDRGINCPDRVSMIAAGTDPSFEWSSSVPSHIRHDHLPLVRRVVRWAKNVARGKEDLRQAGIEADFIEGKTVGPAPK